MTNPILHKNPIYKVHINTVKCKFCKEPDSVVKYGLYKKIQQYYCKQYERKFTDNGSLVGMRTPIEQMSSAMSMFYEGLSLSAIQRQLRQTHGSLPSTSTIYEWIIRFTDIAVSAESQYRAKTGKIWVADETVLKIGGQNVWFWDVIDYDTRFLLASHFSVTRKTSDAEKLMLNALEHVQNIPKTILTDKLRAYLDGIERVFGADTKHIQSKGFIKEPNTNLIERFHGTLKNRTKVMRGMKSIDTAKIVMDGWLIYYNFFRPHEGLKGKTPAHMAGINFPFQNWTDVVKGGDTRR